MEKIQVGKTTRHVTLDGSWLLPQLKIIFIMLIIFQINLLFVK